MPDTYNLSEIFRIAEEIEHNGYTFYTRAAAQVQNKATRQIMLQLANEEQKHQAIFAELRAELCRREDLNLVDLDGNVQAYLAAIADAHVFNLNRDHADLLSSIQSPQSALHLAIGFERDTIAYFAAFKSAVQPQNRDKIDLLINEELGHIQKLQQVLKDLPK